RFVDGSITVHDHVEDAIRDADVVIVLRLQLERMQAGLIPSEDEYSRFFGLDAQRLKLAKPDALVMHPGPQNNGLEISFDVNYSEQSAIRTQVNNGLAVRMALLLLTLSGEKVVL
ncbi:MAG: aspartate carbamoyltransferase, partial [Selenomonadaceae bacterium]|nr:aspartate carbamoyltransferase [Selenomonadaceae bacterium]